MRSDARNTADTQDRPEHQHDSPQDEVSFWATVELHGATATGLPVPPDTLAALGSDNRPAVTVTIGAHTYPSTVGNRGGVFLVPLSAANRSAAGVAAGDVVDVTLVLDQAPREVEVPPDLAAAPAAGPGARAFYAGLSFTYRREWARWIDAAKKPQTRTSRLERTIEALQAGRATR